MTSTFLSKQTIETRKLCMPRLVRRSRAFGRKTLQNAVASFVSGAIRTGSIFSPIFRALISKQYGNDEWKG